MKKAMAEATSAFMAVVGAFLVVAALLPVINPGLTAVSLKTADPGNAPIVAMVIAIVAGVLLMAAGLKLSKHAKTMQ